MSTPLLLLYVSLFLCFSPANQSPLCTLSLYDLNSVVQGPCHNDITTSSPLGYGLTVSNMWHWGGAALSIHSKKVLYLCVGPVIDLQPVQGVPRLSANACWDWHLPPTILLHGNICVFITARSQSSIYFWNVLIAPDIKNCQAPKAGIKCLVLFTFIR